MNKATDPGSCYRLAQLSLLDYCILLYFTGRSFSLITMTVNAAATAAPLTSMASAMFFGTIIVTTVALSVKAVALGEFGALHKAAHHPRSSALDIRSMVSVYTLLVHMSIFGMILFYAYLCEYHPPYPHGVKTYDRDQFFFLTACLFVLSAFTMKKHKSKLQQKPKNPSSLEGSDGGKDSLDDIGTTKKQEILAFSHRQVAPADEATEVLNRDQTEEWKGWMQFMFLLYHYFHAEEVYNAIRIMITCYVWMTGFGNFSFFYLKGDYSSIRVMQMLWRLNFLVIFLCLTQGTTYILYYICLLHTYFFLMVYVAMRIFKDVNYTKYGIRIKLCVLALIIFFVWDLDLGLFKFIHYPFLGETPMLGATGGAMWEWYFRSTLDHWSTFFGMLFALNFPITSLFYRKLETQPWHIQWPAKGIIAAVAIGATFWWVTGPFDQKKFAYNQTNAYFGWIPMLSYIYLRNLSPWLRGHTLDLLHQIGKTTLETYLMQHHIWLTSDAKSLLILIPGWPKMNFLVVSLVYVFFSRRLYQLTLFLRGMLLPNDQTACVKNMLYLGGALAGSVLLAYFLDAVEALNLTTVAMVSIMGGGLLFKTVLDATGVAEPQSNMKAVNQPVSFWAAGAVVVLLLGSCWHTMAVHGAGKIKAMPDSCAEYVNKGKWIQVDVCNEGARGNSFRDHNLGGLATCQPLTPSYVFGWEAAPSNSMCRVVQRGTKSLAGMLKHRRVVFVGDSMIRHLYFSFLRQLGQKNAGMYNTTMDKWSNRNVVVASNIRVDFVWAPFAADVKAAVASNRNINSDVMIAGGGAWDRLHHYNTTETQKSFANDVAALAKELKSTRRVVPLIWVTPTTINDLALSDDKNNKRANIPEANMAAVRALYQNKGVLDSVSFVLDGPMFTKDRVADSYDGVHYPLPVYDAGAQSIANALDWVLEKKTAPNDFKPNQPGAMAHPPLGVMMLGFVLIACFMFDGFFGLSYLSALFDCGQSTPIRLYYEAFHDLHTRAGLPPIPEEKAHLRSSGNQVSDESESQEMRSFLNNGSEEEQQQQQGQADVRLV